MPLQTPEIPAPPDAPQPPPAPGAPAVLAQGPGMPGIPLTGVPRTAREMRALRQRRSELSDQLTSASSRRSELVRTLTRIDPGARDGVRQRIELLDQRILQLEGDIARTGQLVVAAPSELIAGAEPGPRFPVNNGRMNYTAIGLAFTVLVLMPVALAMARLLWRRATVRPAPARASTEDSQRLLRLEQAIDTIAVEVERISEGQRFVAQLMADQAAAPRALEGVPGAGRGH
jgi:hypothetical protein